MEELLEQNRQLITNEIEYITKEIKKIDENILKEAKPFQQGNVFPVTLDKIANLKIKREKLLHTQTAFYAILGQWKNK